MWMILAREPRPDAKVWPGRRLFAAVDAVAWPTIGWMLLDPFRKTGGLFVAVVLACLAVSAVRRLFTALNANHRYHFTTWRWGRGVAWLLVFGAVLTLTLPR
jgi:hypothetical protein